MRIALNGWFLGQPQSGSGQYVRHLRSELLRRGDLVCLTFCPAAHAGGPDIVPLPRPRLPADLAKVWLEQISLPRVARKHGVGILHYPYFAAPLVCGCPVVVTIHDLIPLLFPEYSRNPHVRLYNALVSATARRAGAIIADSEHTRRDIEHILHIPRERVYVIHLAPDEALAATADSNTATAAKERHGLGDYILYVGGLNRHKNVPALLAAYAEARKTLKHTYQLAIVGRPHSTNAAIFPDLRQEAQQLGLTWTEAGGPQSRSAHVLFLGFVPEADKPGLYAGARLFVFPSLYEGFGLPPLEAMACGVPVISSNAASLPEVVGDGGLLIEPTDVRALAHAISQVLSNEDLWQDLRLRGLRQAARFSWKETAELTAQVYRETAERFRLGRTIPGLP